MRFIGALTLALAMWPEAPAAQMFVSTGRDTLRGLPGVEVAVENMPPELQEAGLSTALVRTGVEQRLRAGGVAIYPSQQANPSIAKAYLYVKLNALRLPGQLQAVAVQVQLRQTLRSPVTSSNIVNAMTWDAHDLAVLTDPDARPLQDVIDEMVDRFVADWRAVH